MYKCRLPPLHSHIHGLYVVRIGPLSFWENKVGKFSLASTVVVISWAPFAIVVISIIIVITVIVFIIKVDYSKTIS